MTGSDGATVVGLATGTKSIRFKPDGSEFEAYCGAMGNAVGVEFSDAGDCYASGTFGVNESGQRDVLNHCVEGGAYPVRGQPLVDHKMTGEEMPNLAQFGASASSDLMIYRDDVFGAEYRGNLFSAMFNMRKVARHILEPDGATYRCETADFLTSPDPDFHATDVLQDADGSVLVVDTGAWFLIGCPTSVIAKPQISGGIYRIRRSDAQPINDPWGATVAWDSLTPEELVERLDDDRFAVRDRAMNILASRKTSALAALRDALGEPSTRRRLNAVWTLSRIDDSEAAAGVRSALSDSADEVRQAAATAAGLFRDRQALPQLAPLVNNDVSLAVRREAATSLGRIGDPEVAPALLASLTGVSDRFLEHALIFALIRLDDRQRTIVGLGDPAPEVRRGALIALDQMDHGNLTQADVARALETDDARVQQAALKVISRHPDWADQVVQLSHQWLSASELSQQRRAGLRGLLLAFVKDAPIQTLIAESLASAQSSQHVKLLLLDVISRSELPVLPSGWRAPVLAALRSDDADITRAAVTAIAAVNQSPTDNDILGQQELLALVRSDKQPDDLRIAAAAAALPAGRTIPGDVFELLARQSRSDIEPLTRLTAAGVIGTASLDVHQRDRVIMLIAEAGPLEMSALVRAIENSDFRPVGRQLIQSLDKSPGLTALPIDRLAKLLDKLPEDIRSEGDSLLQRSHFDLEGQRRRLEELKDALVDGDADRGRSLFFGSKASCAACHRVGNEGGAIGPDLTTIGEIRTRKDLLEAIAFPSASFARNFEPYTVRTTSGIAHSGIIARTTGDAVYLISPDRVTIRIPRTEIEDDGVSPSTVSIMPQSLDRLLEPSELKDLLAFLGSLRELTPK